MRIVIATGGLNGHLSASQACDAMASGLTGVENVAELQSFPLAAGGEGTIESLQSQNWGEWIDCSVCGPLPHTQVQAGFLWYADTKTAVIEMARALGLTQLPPEQRNPLHCTSTGAGELLCAARDHGAAKIFLAVGDCASADLGIGCAAVLGWQFLDAQEHPVEVIGQNLLKIRTIIPPEQAWEIPVTVLCDVPNPLLGLHGTAKALAPQQGARRADVVLLEVGLVHLAHCLAMTCQVEVGHAAGGGAGGGLAAGAAVFLNADLVSGVQSVMEQTGASSACAQADWVLTSTRCLDRLSLGETILAGVVTSGQEHKVPVVVFANQVDLTEQQWRDSGVHAVVDLSATAFEEDDVAKRLGAAVKAWGASLK